MATASDGNNAVTRSRLFDIIVLENDSFEYNIIQFNCLGTPATTQSVRQTRPSARHNVCEPYSLSNPQEGIVRPSFRYGRTFGFPVRIVRQGYMDRRHVVDTSCWIALGDLSKERKRIR